MSSGTPVITHPPSPDSASRRIGRAGEPERAANSETPGSCSTSRLPPSTATAVAPSSVCGRKTHG